MMFPFTLLNSFMEKGGIRFGECCLFCAAHNDDDVDDDDENYDDDDGGDDDDDHDDYVSSKRWRKVWRLCFFCEDNGVQRHH